MGYCPLEVKENIIIIHKRTTIISCSEMSLIAKETEPQMTIIYIYQELRRRVVHLIYSLDQCTHLNSTVLVNYCNMLKVYRLAFDQAVDSLHKFYHLQRV